MLSNWVRREVSLHGSLLKSTNFALQILKETYHFMWTGIWPSFLVETDQKTARWKEVSGELQSSNAKNGKVKTRFFLQPSHSALNTPASNNLDRATSECLLHLFLSPTFSASLTHPLGHKKTVLWDTRAQDKRGRGSHMEACRSYAAANKCNHGFPTSTWRSGFCTSSQVVMVS